MPKDTFLNLPEDKRRRILSLAIEAFAEDDYKNVSISELVRRAGIAKGSFYQYFEDKQDLYLHLIDLAGQEKSRFLAENPPPEDAAGTFEYLRWLYAVGVRFEFANPRLAQIAYRAVFGDAPLPSETRRVLEESSQGFFRDLVRRGQAEGHLRPEIDPDLAAFVFNTVFTNLGGYLLDRLDLDPQDLRKQLDRQNNPEAERLFSAVIDLLEHGMAPPTSRRRIRKTP